jgi:hypothetical protein
VYKLPYKYRRLPVDLLPEMWIFLPPGVKTYPVAKKNL